MNWSFVFIVIGLVLHSASSQFESHSQVTLLNSNNFKELVLDSKDYWIVLFFYPDPRQWYFSVEEYESSVQYLRGIARVGAVNLNIEKELGKIYTNRKQELYLYFFAENKQKLLDFKISFTRNGLIPAIFEEVKNIIKSNFVCENSHMSNCSSFSQKNTSEDKSVHSSNQDNTVHLSNGEFDSSQTVSVDPSLEIDLQYNGDVIILTDDNFESLVVNSKQPWFVHFFIPQSSYSDQVPWDQLAYEMKSEGVRIAELDASVHSKIVKRYSIKTYPTLKYFPSILSPDQEIVNYNGVATTFLLAMWVKEKRDQKQHMKYAHLLNQSIYDDYCTNHDGFCVIYFIPYHVRGYCDEYISLIKEISNANRGSSYTYLFNLEFDQTDFSRKLALFDFPFTVIISHKLNAYQSFDGFLLQKDLEISVSQFNSGNSNYSFLPPLPKIKKVKQWYEPFMYGNDLSPDPDLLY